MAFNTIPTISAKRARRFWKSVEVKGDAECWPVKNPNYLGYKQIRVQWKLTMSHRVAYQLTYGEIPGGVCVRHRCDNPSCCNPAHLFLGTKGDNNRDRNAKGRTSRGRNHWKSVLGEADVMRVRQMRREGMTQQAIADHFGVRQPAIWKVLSGRLWRHVK